MGFRWRAAELIPIKQVTGPVFFVVAFLCVVWILRSFHPEGAGFDKSGVALFVYQIGRLALLFFIVTLSVTLGDGVLRLFGIEPTKALDSQRKAFILSFFVGMTIYGVVYATLGMLQLLSLASALIGTAPVLIFAMSPISRTTTAIQFSLRGLFADAPLLHRAFYIPLLIACAGGFALFILMHVVAVFTLDPNIWEHYLHYYREVLKLGTTQPHEVWHHFFATKPAGFFFLANELSDFFGVPIVSGSFAIVAGVVIIDLIDDYCDDLVWAIFGAALFFIFMASDWASGTMFKHHVVILGYSALALWSVIQLRLNYSLAGRAAIVATMAAAFLYMGFYASLIGIIFPLAFLLVGLGNIALRTRWNFYPLLTFAVAAATGTLLSFLLNYAVTGVPDITPMRFFWPLSDQAKAAGVFGLGGIDFFLRINNEVSASSDGWLGLLWRFMRFPLASWAFLLTAILAIGLAIIDRRDRTQWSTLGLLLTLAAFILPLSILAEAFQSHAVVYRAGLFTIVFTVIGAVVVWQRTIDRVATMASWSPFGSERKKSIVYDWTAGILIVLTFYGASITALQSIGREQFGYARWHALGLLSLKQTMTLLEPKINKQTVGVEGAIRVDALADYREHMAPGDRIMRLTYEAGYSNSLPGDGVLSEPTYALVDDPRKLLAAAPDEVAEYLKQKRINHFIISLRASLFTTIAFTKLFDPSVMDRFFSVSYRDGDLFILTWRKADAKPLPKSLIVAMDFKRTGVLAIPYSAEFKREMLAGSDAEIDTIDAFEQAKDEFVTKLDRKIETLTSGLSSSDARETINYLWWQATDTMRYVDIWAVSPTRCWTLACRTGNEAVEILKPFSARKMREMMLERFLTAFRDHSLDTFGPYLTPLFEGTNEREPFGPKRTD